MPFLIKNREPVLALVGYLMGSILEPCCGASRRHKNDKRQRVRHSATDFCQLKQFVHRKPRCNTNEQTRNNVGLHPKPVTLSMINTCFSDTWEGVYRSPCVNSIQQRVIHGHVAQVMEHDEVEQPSSNDSTRPRSCGNTNGVRLWWVWFATRSRSPCWQRRVLPKQHNSANLRPQQDNNAKGHARDRNGRRDLQSNVVYFGRNSCQGPSVHTSHNSHNIT
jgi:hypothetical protein